MPATNPAYGKHGLSKRVRIIALCQKQKQTFKSDLEHLPVFEALRRADPEQNAGTIYESNPEHLLILVARVK